MSFSKKIIDFLSASERVQVSHGANADYARFCADQVDAVITNLHMQIQALKERVEELECSVEDLEEKE